MRHREMTVFGRSRAPKSWYRIEPQANGAVEVLIYDEIAWYAVDAQSFAQEFAAITAPLINLRINSPGGSVFDGMAIYNTIRNHPARIEASVDGIAASIASVIALAADEVTMAEGSFLMIHNPWALVIGDAGDMRQTADTLDKIGGSMADIYAARSALDRDEVMDAMAAETWYTAAEAVEAGFAAEAVASEGAAASFDLSIYSRVPDALQATAGRRAGVPQCARDFERLLRDAGFDRAAAKAITADGFGGWNAPRDVGNSGMAEPGEVDAAALEALVERIGRLT